MDIFRYIREIGQRRVVLYRPGPKATPIRSVRRKYWMMGRQWSVCLHPDTKNRMRIDPQKSVWHISLYPATRENYESFLENWRRRQARACFSKAIDKWLPLFHQAGYGIEKPRFKIFNMRRAWGRCYYTKNLLTLNVHLVETPPECVDYIILHELCHFVEHNHSAAFYTLMERFLPHWKEIDKILKQFARENRIIR